MAEGLELEIYPRNCQLGGAFGSGQLKYTVNNDFSMINFNIGHLYSLYAKLFYRFVSKLILCLTCTSHTIWERDSTSQEHHYMVYIVSIRYSNHELILTNLLKVGLDLKNKNHVYIKLYIEKVNVNGCQKFCQEGSTSL